MAGLSLGGFGAAAARLKARWFDFISNQIVIHASLVLTFLFLAIAAYLWGPEQLLYSSGALMVAFGMVLYFIYSWFAEEARRKRVQLGEENPRPADAKNADLRDEMITVCLAMFLVTPLFLQTLNDTYLHYAVAPDHFGVAETFCPKQQPGTFCDNHQRLLQLPQWLGFAVVSLVKTSPVAEDIPLHSSIIGIAPTKATPGAAGVGLKLLFVGLLGTMVWGQFKNVGRTIKNAISTLKVSHQFAAGLGPIALGALKNVIADDNADEIRQLNAIRAVAAIAERYEGARPEIQKLFGDEFILLFRSVARARDKSIVEALTSIGSALCHMGSDDGIVAIRQRILNPQEYAHTRKQLLRMLRSSLSDSRAEFELTTIAGALQHDDKSTVIKLTNDLLTELTKVDGDDGLAEAT